MTRLERIEREVEQLSDEEMVRFRVWLEAHDASRFDTAIEADAASGRLDALADEALAAFRAGLTKPL